MAKWSLMGLVLPTIATLAALRLTPEQAQSCMSAMIYGIVGAVSFLVVREVVGMRREVVERHHEKIIQDALSGVSRESSDGVKESVIGKINWRQRQVKEQIREQSEKLVLQEELRHPTKKNI